MGTKHDLCASREDIAMKSMPRAPAAVLILLTAVGCSPAAADLIDPGGQAPSGNSTAVDAQRLEAYEAPTGAMEALRQLRGDSGFLGRAEGDENWWDGFGPTGRLRENP
jgi:hypothetical protein